jgi:hypothetical protein
MGKTYSESERERETFVVESKQVPLLKPVQGDITDKSCISISSSLSNWWGTRGVVGLRGVFSLSRWQSSNNASCQGLSIMRLIYIYVKCHSPRGPPIRFWALTLLQFESLPANLHNIFFPLITTPTIYQLKMYTLTRIQNTQNREYNLNYM